MAKTKLNLEPHYSFTFRYKENTRKALKKITSKNRLSQNKAVEACVLTVANENIKIKS